ASTILVSGGAALIAWAITARRTNSSLALAGTASVGASPDDVGKYKQLPTATRASDFRLPPPNGIAVSGFTLALIGLFVCGCTAPLGLPRSLASLQGGRRGLAVAGVVIGAGGSLLWLWAGAAQLHWSSPAP